jgi:anhydro-N-acetylmuramic acid kinase
MFKDSFIAIGLMSGTSMDGIDAAIINTDGKTQIKHLGCAYFAYANDFQAVLKAAEKAVARFDGDIVQAERYLQQNALPTLTEITEKITDYHAKAVQQLLAKSAINPKLCEVIGFHGQTLWHKPVKQQSLQLGDGLQLAKVTGIKVVNQFRQNDLKHGGQGAPLVPLYHQALAVRDKRLPLIVANCGGIANITYISGPGEEAVWGFDTGPGNVLLDRFIRERTDNHELMDRDGRYGLQGHVSLAILQQLWETAVIKNGQNYLSQSPPKSLDSHDCRLIPVLAELSMADACATLAAFTAQTMAQGVKLLGQTMPKTWALAGGGWHNPVIKAQLQHFLGDPIQLLLADKIGWQAQAMEAECFAYLAVRSLLDLPLSVPQTTGVAKPTTGGELSLP